MTDTEAVTPMNKHQACDNLFYAFIVLLVVSLWGPLTAFTAAKRDLPPASPFDSQVQQQVGEGVREVWVLPNPQPQCVKIYVDDGQGNGSEGSGAYIGPCLVVTAQHVVSERKADDAVVVKFPTGPGRETIKGTVVAANEEQDLAIIRLDYDPPWCEPFQLCLVMRPGMRLSVQGYGGAGYKQTWGALARKTVTPSKGDAYWNIVTAPSVSGDSGGPVLDDRGRFAGTLWGSGDGETYFTPTEIVLQGVIELMHPMIQ